MSEAGKNNWMQTCPQCGSHCPVDALQCGKGRKYFGVEDTGCGHEHGHGCGHGHHHHRDGLGGPHPDRDDLAGKFERCGRLLSSCLGKRRGQGRILRTLCRRGDMPQRELQELLGIQAGSMSEIAAKLEDKGLITRVRSEEDRRKVSLSVTEQGRVWVEQSDEEHILRRRAELFAVLTPEEQRALEEMLDKLSGRWSQRMEHRDGREEAHDRGK